MTLNLCVKGANTLDSVSGLSLTIRIAPRSTTAGFAMSRPVSGPQWTGPQMEMDMV